MDYTSKAVNMLVKPLENAAVSYLGAKYLLGIEGNMSLPVIGNKDSSMAIGVLAGATSLATETVASYVLPEVVDGTQLYVSSSMLLRPVLMSAGLYAAIASSSPAKAQNVGLAKIALLGAGSEVASSYLNSAIVQPWLHPDSAGY